MRIKFWGSRGSTPVSGTRYMRYGGDTSCIEIRSKSQDIIIVDSGTGIRRLGNSLVKENCLKCHLLFTHAHWDHLMGLPSFKLLYSKDTELIIHQIPFQSESVEKMLSMVMAPPYFPIGCSGIPAMINYVKTGNEPFNIGSITVVPIPINHPNGGSGYKFIENGKSLVFITDNELGCIHPSGLPFEAYLNFCKGADVLIHDAEFTPEEYRNTMGWGHSSYKDVLKLAISAEVKELGLFHFNHERTDRQIDAVLSECKKILKRQGSCINCFAVSQDMVIVF